MNAEKRSYSLPCRIEAVFPEETFTPTVIAATLEALSKDAAVIRCGRVDLDTLNLIMRETRHARLRPAESNQVAERFRVTGRIVWVEDGAEATRFGVALNREGEEEEIEAFLRAAQEDAWGKAPEAVTTVEEAASKNSSVAWLSMIAGAKSLFRRSPRPSAVTNRGAEVATAAEKSREKIECAVAAQFSVQTGTAVFDVASFRATITSVSPRGIQAVIDEDAPAFRAAMRMSGLSPIKLMHATGGWLGFDEGGKSHATWMRLVWLGGNGAAPSASLGESGPIHAGFALWSDEDDSLGGRWALERAALAHATASSVVRFA